ncbi:MAG: radical SAM protein [Candidatus Omnitrophota bacterium]
MNKIPFPTTVDFALTGKCNLRCKHCNTSDTWDLKEELSFEEIISVLDQLKEEKIFSLNLFGGEPFCYPKIYELFELFNSYPMRVTILTNGTLIDADAVKRLKKLRFLENIQISIDGSNPSIHDWQRGEGSFFRSIRTVRLLQENDLPVSIKAIINNHNYKDIENMVDLALSLDLEGMDFGDAVECGRAAVFASDMRFEGEIHSHIMEEMFRLKKKYPDFNFSGTLAQKMEMLEDFYENGPGKGSRGTFSTCPAGQNMLSVRSDGKVVPCSAFWTLVCGDVRKNSLRDIWDNSEVLNEIRALADESLADHKAECRECDYFAYCNGGCRAAAYYASGNDLRGFDKANCLVFSDKYGFRVKENVIR